VVRAARESPLAVCRYLAALDNGAPVKAVMVPPGKDRRVFYTDDLSGFNFIRNKLPISQVIDQVARYAAFAEPPSVAVQSTLISECLPGFLAAQRLALLPDSVAPRIWLGNRIVVPPHVDEGDNIGCVVAGRRRFTLFPPEQIANLYIGPLEYTPAAAPVSMVDVGNPDFERFPRFRDALAAAEVAELEAGDAIYIPALWWHQVESLDVVNVLINYWWGGTHGAVNSPVDCLLHALLVIRDLPAEHRAAWGRFFEHFVFGADAATSAHIPVERRGALGGLPEPAASAIRERLIEHLKASGTSRSGG